MKSIILLTVIAIGLLNAAGAAGDRHYKKQPPRGRKSFPSGDCRFCWTCATAWASSVRGAETDRIEVDYRMTAWQNPGGRRPRLEAMRVTFSQEAGAVTIDAVQEKRAAGQSNKVDLTITVPRTIDLIVTNNVGKVEARDLRTLEQLQITANVGDIVLRDIEAGARATVIGNVGDVTFEGAL